MRSCGSAATATFKDVEKGILTPTRPHARPLPTFFSLRAKPQRSAKGTPRLSTEAAALLAELFEHPLRQRCVQS